MKKKKDRRTNREKFASQKIVIRKREEESGHLNLMILEDWPTVQISIN